MGKNKENSAVYTGGIPKQTIEQTAQSKLISLNVRKSLIEQELREIEIKSELLKEILKNNEEDFKFSA